MLVHTFDELVNIFLLTDVTLVFPLTQLSSRINIMVNHHVLIPTPWDQTSLYDVLMTFWSLIFLHLIVKGHPSHRLQSLRHLSHHTLRSHILGSSPDRLVRLESGTETARSCWLFLYKFYNCNYCYSNVMKLKKVQWTSCSFSYPLILRCPTIMSLSLHPFVTRFSHFFQPI